MATCAAGNVCATRCPVGIETGTMIIGERARRRTDADRKKARWAADHTAAIERSMTLGIGAQSLARAVVGNGVTDAVAGVARSISGKRIPRVSKGLRPGPGAPKRGPVASRGAARADRLLPRLPSRMFGAPTRENGLLTDPRP
jgi:D-lactate dehydrogenase